VIIFLHGSDSYRRQHKFRELLSAYKGKYANPDMLELDFEDDDAFTRAKDFLGQPSMFAESKVLALSGSLEGRDEYADVLRRELETPKNFVIISTAEVPAGELAFLLEAPVRRERFAELLGTDFENFVRGLAKDAGVDFDAAGFRALMHALQAEKPENRSWRAAAETHKLSLATGKVTAESVRSLVRLIPTGDIYALARSFMYGRSAAARLTALEELEAGNFDPAWAFNTLCFLAKGRETTALAAADLAVKSGSLDYETALTKVALG
jgi:DNA polymerase III delta subunit